jgi:hypothetical protein
MMRVYAPTRPPVGPSSGGAGRLRSTLCVGICHGPALLWWDSPARWGLGDGACKGARVLWLHLGMWLEPSKAGLWAGFTHARGKARGFLSGVYRRPAFSSVRVDRFVVLQACLPSFLP